MVPFNCFYDTKSRAIYRIDILDATDYLDENAKYRMAVYLKDTDLREKPDYLLDVDYDIEGSAGVREYECSDKKAITFHSTWTSMNKLTTLRQR